MMVDDVADGDFTLGAGLHLLAVHHQLDIVNRRGLAHGAGDRFKPREISEQNRSLGLPEAGVNLAARKSKPAVEDVSI